MAREPGHALQAAWTAAGVLAGLIDHDARQAVVSRQGCMHYSALGKVHFFGGTMWQGIQRRFYSVMYYFGRTPPTSAEIDAAFEKIEAEATIAADDPWCDCLVMAGPTVVQCKTRRTSTCEAMGQLRPDVNASPHKVGFCKSVSEGSK